MSDTRGDNVRDLESGITADFTEALSYGAYLDLPRLLSAQHPRSVPLLHDEMLFIIQHQVAELWLKLLLHELHSARDLLATDDLSPALKRLARVKHVLKQLVELGLQELAVPLCRVPPRQQERRHAARLRPRRGGS